MKYFILSLVLLTCAGGIGVLFWNQEFKYSLPTPVPANYKPVATGKTLELKSIDSQLSGPLFLHFYNPDCPCSRFNAKAVRELIFNYSDSVKLCIIVPSLEFLDQAKSTFGENQNYIVDKDKLIATMCGVYSTPQAVIVDRNNALYYRGNYNVARYCTKRATNFAELSLIAFLNKQPAPAFSVFATQAYGCEIPDNF